LPADPRHTFGPVISAILDAVANPVGGVYFVFVGYPVGSHHPPTVKGEMALRGYREVKVSKYSR
ncbi:hypothetical protein WJX84_005550, partial [Apatococcus fuscideae]